jgi:hypothetical protein
MSGDPTTNFAGRRLRMGIMCQGTTMEAWQADCVRQVLALGFVEPTVLIVDGQPEAHARQSLLRRLGRALTSGRTGWNLFQRAFVRRATRAASPVDLTAELGTAARLTCLAPKHGSWARHFTAEELAQIQAHDLDFILRFAFNIVRGQIHAAARLGVWSYHHDDLDIYRGSPACFWPLYEGQSVQGVTLQRLTDGLDNGIVLARAWFRSVRHSYVRTLDSALLGGAGLVAKVCRQLHAGAGQQAWGPPSATTARIRTVPGNLTTLRFCARLLGRKMANAWTVLLRHGVWNVGVIDRPIHAFLDLDEAPPASWIPPESGAPRGRILADPFGRRHDGGLTLLCEQTDTPEGRG